MKYAHWKDDVRAIESLLAAGQISVDEAHEMREYIEELAETNVV